VRHEADIVKTAHKARTACKHAVFRLHSLSGNEATTSLDMFREIILCALLVVVLVVVRKKRVLVAAPMVGVWDGFYQIHQFRNQALMVVEH
jgi:homospermidine synthase